MASTREEKRRPNAEDRLLADVFRGLTCGLYSLSVIEPAIKENGLAFCAPAQIKMEGMTQIEIGNRRIVIRPETVKS